MVNTGAKLESVVNIKSKKVRIIAAYYAAPSNKHKHMYRLTK